MSQETKFTFKCVGYRHHKEEFIEMPTDFPICKECSNIMLLDKASVKNIKD